METGERPRPRAGIVLGGYELLEKIDEGGNGLI